MKPSAGGCRHASLRGSGAEKQEAHHAGTDNEARKAEGGLRWGGGRPSMGHLSSLQVMSTSTLAARQAASATMAAASASLAASISALSASFSARKAARTGVGCGKGRNDTLRANQRLFYQRAG